MSAREHDAIRDDLAPYLLGALSTLEAEALTKHLRKCGECQRELAELRTGAEALARAVEYVDPPASLRERLLSEVGAQTAPAPAPAPAPRRTASGHNLRGVLDRLRRPGGTRRGQGLTLRPSLAALATVLVAGIAGLGGWSLGRSSEETGTVTATVDRTRLPSAAGELELARGGDYAILRLGGLRDPGASRIYEIWIERDGQLSPGPTFSPSAGGGAIAGVPEGIADADAIYVTRERAGGARTPSEKPVVSVPLASS